jgi:hypothetical protein
MSMLAAYGLAIGPNPHFADMHPNPSLYGLLKVLIPGVDNMRAIGRMAVVGQACLGLLLFSFYARLYIKQEQRKGAFAVALFFASALFLQLAESWPVKAQVNRYATENLAMNVHEKGKMSTLQGTACVFPATPWPKNTHAMLYFLPLEKLRLINGYSAHSTPFFDKVMEAGAERREPTPQQLALLAPTGCEYLILWKGKAHKSRLRTLLQTYSLLYENRAIAVLQYRVKP